MILACNNLTKSFGISTILSNISFHIEKGDKVGLVGVNGAGKTTLIKIISGELDYDEGQILIPSNAKLGHLSQHQSMDFSLSIYEEVLKSKQDIITLENKIRSVEQQMHNLEGEQLDSLMNHYSDLQHQFEQLGGYGYKSEVIGVLKGLGFEDSDFEKTINTLSGGQKTRVALAQLLLSKPDVLLLDEPTNHLDMTSINWLEQFINSYKNTVIIISHDRYFLDKTINSIIEIENTKATTYNGNYSSYIKEKAIKLDLDIKHYENQQKEIKKQEESIKLLKSFNREKSIKRAESKEKQLAKVERIEKPSTYKAEMNLTIEPQITSGKDVLHIEDLSKSFDNLTLFQDLNMDIKKGEKIALIGANGTGKTTIFKLITNELNPNSGIIKIGAKVKVGYYDQEHQSLNENNNLIQEIESTYPDLKISKIRNILASFLFRNDNVYKKISQLSGGERGRLSLAKLMLSEANFLLLDEPTNHLDIISKEILENVLKNYTGTVLYISHDRYFINQTATKVMELTPNGIISYLGNYDYYMEKKEQLLEASLKNSSNIQHIKKQPSANKNDWKKNKENQARKRKKENLLKQTEEKIHEIEQKIEEIDSQLCLEDIYTNHIKLNELNEQKDSLSSKLLELYELWESNLDN